MHGSNTVILTWYILSHDLSICLNFFQLKSNICVTVDMAFIQTMHHIRPNITYLIKYLLYLILTN